MSNQFCDILYLLFLTYKTNMNNKQSKTGQSSENIARITFDLTVEKKYAFKAKLAEKGLSITEVCSKFVDSYLKGKIKLEDL